MPVSAKFPADGSPARAYVSAVASFSKTTGNLLRKFSLTESSLIVHWCSEDYGLIKTVAKGARRPRSVFAGKLDLFFQCEIEIVQARRGDLHILKDLAVQKNRLGIRRTYLQTLAASYFVRLVEKVVETETPIPEIANLLDRALNYLEDTEIDRKAILFFEKETARFLGLGEEGKDPAQAIANTFGELPALRGELMGRL